MPNLLDPSFEKTLKKDVEYLYDTKLPIVTVSASFREDLKGFHGMSENESIPDVVFSRAHFSMAAAIALHAWGDKIHPDKAWVVDPTNYVSMQDWKNIQFTEMVGKTLARQPMLKRVKDFVDKFGRGKLPILSSITPPLLHLFQYIDRPILSLHIAAGNILAAQGKTVIQVVTDPHVREEYLDNIEKPNFTLCVFDQKTKIDALEKATIMGKKVLDHKVIVTGPPIDPRVIAAKNKKHPWRSGKLNLCLTTGGLGTNKREMQTIIRNLLPQLKNAQSRYRLMVFAGTQPDIFQMVLATAAEANIPVTKLTDASQPLKDLTGNLIAVHHPQIVDANELLIKFGFPWADGFITKPSGDMAYDAAVSGSFLLTLQEWGIWEHNINEIFEQRGIARKAQPQHILEQLEALIDTRGKSQSWVEKAMNNALTLPNIFYQGCENIIDVVEKTKA